MTRKPSGGSPEDKVRVRLTRPHRHAGIDLAEGTLFELERHFAESIVAMGAGSLLDDGPARPPAADLDHGV